MIENIKKISHVNSSGIHLLLEDEFFSATNLFLVSSNGTKKIKRKKTIGMWSRMNIFIKNEWREGVTEEEDGKKGKRQKEESVLFEDGVE